MQMSPSNFPVLPIPKMKQVLYEICPGDQATYAMLDDAAKLFSENYGIWGEHSHKPGTKQPPWTPILLLISNQIQFVLRKTHYIQPTPTMKANPSQSSSMLPCQGNH